MASLPEHWESDYDGSRWFFRYKPTGIIQYTFPKPGDEFPEYIDATAPPLDLAPEERLVSQQQVKRRSTTDGQPVKSLVNKEKDEVVSATLAKGEGVGFWFQPDYMYLGPGSYDISPVNEYDEEEDLGRQSEKKKPSPLPSEDTTSLGQSTQVAPPLGNVAELPTESTAQCLEELHPPPVELPDHGVMVENTDPTAYANAFDIAPVELPTESQSMDYYRSAPQMDPNIVSSGPEDWYRSQRQGPHALVRQGEQPYAQSSSSSSHIGNHIGNPGKPAAQYRPYNPARVASEGQFSRHSIASSYLPGTGQVGTAPLTGETPGLIGDAPASHPSAVPSVLRPPQPPPKRPLDNVDMARQFGNPAYWAQRQSISGPVTRQQESHLAARVPSVLQPARGRPILPADNTQPNRRVSPPKPYQAYKPYQLLHQTVNNAASMSCAENQQPYRPASAAPTLQHPVSQQGGPTETRPVAARTNTLPTHMPSLPFMGIGPQAAVPDPAVPTSPELVHGPNSKGKVVSEEPGPVGGHIDLSAYINCSNQDLPKSSDFPEPLRVARVIPEMDATPSVAPRIAPIEQAPTTNSLEGVKAFHTSTFAHAGQGGPAGQQDKPTTTVVESQAVVSDVSSVSSQQTGYAVQLKSPVERPATSFSVVSDFSIVSEPLPQTASVSRDTSHSSRYDPTPSSSEVPSPPVHSTTSDRQTSPSTLVRPNDIEIAPSRASVSPPSISDPQLRPLSFEANDSPITSPDPTPASSHLQNSPQNSNTKTPPRHMSSQTPGTNGNNIHAQASPSSHRTPDPKTPPHPRRQSQGSAHSVLNQTQAHSPRQDQTGASQPASSRKTSPAQCRPQSVAYGQTSSTQVPEPQRPQHERRGPEIHGQHSIGTTAVDQAPVIASPPRPPKEPLGSSRGHTAPPLPEKDATQGTSPGQKGSIHAQPRTQQNIPTAPGSGPLMPQVPTQGQPIKPQTALQHPPFVLGQGQGNTPMMLVRDPRFPQMMAYQWHPQPGTQLPVGGPQYAQMAVHPVFAAPAHQGALQPVLPIRPGPQNNQQKPHDSPVKEKTGWFSGLMKGGNGKKTEEPTSTSPVDNDPTRRNRLQKPGVPPTQPVQPISQNLPRHTHATASASVQSQPSTAVGSPRAQFPGGAHPPKAQHIPSGQFVQPISGHDQYQKGGIPTHGIPPQQHGQIGSHPSTLPQAPLVYHQPRVPSAYTPVQGVQAADPRPMAAGVQAASHGWNAPFNVRPSQPPISPTGQVKIGHHPQPQVVQPLQQVTRPQSMVNTAQPQHQAKQQQPIPTPGVQHTGGSPSRLGAQQSGVQAKGEASNNTKPAGGWGNPSGYDGSGWGDDDDY